MWESWAVLAIFIINLVFMLIMSFVSPYFKEITARGIGKIFNVIWICVIIAAAGVLMFYNVRCTLDGGFVGASNGSGNGSSASVVAGKMTDALESISKSSSNCKMLAISIVVFLALLTILNMTWIIYNTIEYNKKHQKTTVVVKQEQKGK